MNLEADIHPPPRPETPMTNQFCQHHLQPCETLSRESTQTHQTSDLQKLRGNTFVGFLKHYVGGKLSKQQKQNK